MTKLRNLLPKLFNHILVKEPGQVQLLGRWGYHWEKKIMYEKYYDNCQVSFNKNDTEKDFFESLSIQEQIALCS